MSDTPRSSFTLPITEIQELSLETLADPLGPGMENWLRQSKMLSKQ